MTFPETSWTLLAEATLNGDTRGRGALERLCRDYRRPVLVVLRARGFDEQEAEDLTQEFFLRLFQSEAWKRVDRDRGRFRAFIMKSLRNLISNDIRDRSRVKRGGGLPDESLDALADDGNEVPAAEDDEAARLFDREWALRLIQGAFMNVEAGFVADGQEAQFAVLKRFLPGVGAPLGYEEAARLLGRTEGTVKSLVSRLRERYRAALRESVARTVAAAHEVDEELAYLHRVLKER